MSMFNACSARPNWVMPIAAKRARMIDPEHPVFVAVEGDRLAPGFEVGASRVEIGKEPAPGLNRGRFALDKLQVHQPTGRIINEYEERALRAAILKPPVLAAVNLHQLANAVAPGARLMDALSALLAIDPQLGLDHPQPQCLTTERNPMNLV